MSAERLLTRRDFAERLAVTMPALLAGTLPAADVKQALDKLLVEDARDPNPIQVLRRASPWDKGREVSIMGLGGVRLPVVTGKVSQSDPVDYETGSKLVSYALRHGVNYFDSGYIYHQGDSEKFYGHALAKHPRESFYFCTKMPPWNITTLADAKRIFEEQLKRCRMDYFDIYMLHSVIRPEDYEKTYVKTGVLDYLKEERAKGRIRHLGFSFHGRTDFLKELLQREKWEAVLVLVNGIDWRGANRADLLLDALAKAHVPAIAMESLAGGRLAHLRPEAHALLQKTAPGSADASWSLKFAAHPPGLITALTGFTKFEHLKEDITLFNARTFKPMTSAEHAVYARAIELENGGGEGVPCSQCAYCMPCPYGIDIPGIFHVWNNRIKWSHLPKVEDARDHAARFDFLSRYATRVPALRAAAHCIGCGECEKKCPQWQFKIPDELAKIDRYFTSLRLAEPAWRDPSVPREL